MVGMDYAPILRARREEAKRKEERKANRVESWGSLAVAVVGSVVAYFGLVICALLDQGVM